MEELYRFEIQENICIIQRDNIIVTFDAKEVGDYLPIQKAPYENVIVTPKEYNIRGLIYQNQYLFIIDRYQLMVKKLDEPEFNQIQDFKLEKNENIIQISNHDSKEVGISFAAITSQKRLLYIQIQVDHGVNSIDILEVHRDKLMIKFLQSIYKKFDPKDLKLIRKQDQISNKTIAYDIYYMQESQLESYSIIIQNVDNNYRIKTRHKNFNLCLDKEFYQKFKKNIKIVNFIPKILKLCNQYLLNIISICKDDNEQVYFVDFFLNSFNGAIRDINYIELSSQNNTRLANFDQNLSDYFVFSDEKIIQVESSKKQTGEILTQIIDQIEQFNVIGFGFYRYQQKISLIILTQENVQTIKVMELKDQKLYNSRSKELAYKLKDIIYHKNGNFQDIQKCFQIDDIEIEILQIIKEQEQEMNLEYCQLLYEFTKNLNQNIKKLALECFFIFIQVYQKTEIQKKIIKKKVDFQVIELQLMKMNNEFVIETYTQYQQFIIDLLEILNKENIKEENTWTINIFQIAIDYIKLSGDADQIDDNRFMNSVKLIIQQYMDKQNVIYEILRQMGLDDPVFKLSLQYENEAIAFDYFIKQPENEFFLQGLYEYLRENKDNIKTFIDYIWQKDKSPKDYLYEKFDEFHQDFADYIDEKFPEYSWPIYINLQQFEKATLSIVKMISKTKDENQLKDLRSLLSICLDM